MLIYILCSGMQSRSVDLLGLDMAMQAMKENKVPFLFLDIHLRKSIDLLGLGMAMQAMKENIVPFVFLDMQLRKSIDL